MAVSPDNTITTSPDTILTDASGNQWYIDTSGQVVVNGIIDSTTGNVQTLAYENGKIWQMNTSDLWWSKALPTSQWSPTYGTTTSPLKNVATNNYLSTGAGSSVTDSDDNVWTITAGGQVAVNGMVDQTTANVDELAYYNGNVWQKNADNNWYSKPYAAATWTGWANASPPVPISNVSYDDARITPGMGQLVDANGNIWILANNGAGSYQVNVDGVTDPTTANVVEMAYENGVIWQENASGLWYSKTMPASAWSSGIQSASLGGVPVSLTWLGGGNNLASNAADWSPAVAPGPGDVLSISSGTMNIVGNALAGTTLTIAPNATTGYALSDTFNTSGDARLNLVTTSGNYQFSVAMNLNVAAGSTLTLNADIYTANSTVGGGGTIAFVGNNTLAGSTVFDDNLAGSGTINLPSANTVPGVTIINGSVGSGLTFIMNSINATSDLTIAQPSAFAGLLKLSNSPVAVGHVAFEGIQATSADLLNGVLQMFNGTTLVDATRFSDPAGTSVQLHQTSSGVILTAGSFNDTGNAGTLIPLT